MDLNATVNNDLVSRTGVCAIVGVFIMATLACMCGHLFLPLDHGASFFS